LWNLCCFQRNTFTDYFFWFTIPIQVIEERITHIPYVPATPEPLNAPTGNELKPRPVGEENGIVVFSYSPISAVNYVSILYTIFSQDLLDFDLHIWLICLIIF